MKDSTVTTIDHKTLLTHLAGKAGILEDEIKKWGVHDKWLKDHYLLCVYENNVLKISASIETIDRRVEFNGREVCEALEEISGLPVCDTEYEPSSIRVIYTKDKASILQKSRRRISLAIATILTSPIMAWTFL